MFVFVNFPCFLIVVAILVVALILLQVYFMRRKGKWSASDIKFCKKSWQRIVSEKDIRHKVMEADKLLEHMLKRKGYTESLGETLKKQSALFSDINGLWYAHKMRNKIAHEMGYKVGPKDVKLAMRSFKKALKDIGMKV